LTLLSPSAPEGNPDPPSDFIFRNSGDAQQIEIGWWPDDRDDDRSAFFAFAYRVPFAYPVSDGFGEADLKSDAVLGHRAWRDCGRLGRTSARPRILEPSLSSLPIGLPTRFNVRACDPILAASEEGSPPPVR
jgi:hypothetical protein